MQWRPWPTRVFPEHPRFRFRRLLGTGAFGAVYEAFDLDRRALVALKTLHIEEPSALSRFKNEFRSLVRVTHPGLVALYELFDVPQWFFTMELVRGVDLLQYVSGGRRHPGLRVTTDTASAAIRTNTGPDRREADTLDSAGLARLRSVLPQLVRALSALHEQGHLHRDIKPSNILVEGDGRVKVVDFGLVTRLVEDHSGVMAGTPGYMPPEAVRSDPLTEAADWYSVGVIIHEALTGVLPFDSVAAQRLQQKGERLSDLNPGLERAPEDLSQLCLDLLHSDSRSRPGPSLILDRLGDPRPLPVSRADTQAVFVGRDRELRVLNRAFSDSVSGLSRVVMVHGGAGMGKTALIDRFLADLESHHDVLILSGRCSAEEHVPFQGVDRVVDSLCHYLANVPVEITREVLPHNASALAKLFPVVEQTYGLWPTVDRLEVPDASGLRRSGFRALGELLTTLCRLRPVVLFIDDLHLVDDDAADLLVELLTGDEPPPLLFIGSWDVERLSLDPLARRIEEGGTAKGQATESSNVEAHGGPPLPGRGAVSTIRLGSLGDEDAGKLLRCLVKNSAADVAELVREGQGVPHLLKELAVHCLEHCPYGVPPACTRLEAVWHRRIAALEPSARALLDVVVVAGDFIRSDVARLAAGLDEPGMRVETSLVSSRFLARRTERGKPFVAPYHPTIGQAVASMMDADQESIYRHRLAQSHRAIDEDTAGL